MASILSEEQFQCCICLDIFAQPVSIPCGHNFCLACIRSFWDTCERSECPLCKEGFRRRPELRINCGLADITEHFKRSLKVTARLGEGGGARTTGEREPPTESAPGRGGLCRRHQRPLELYCRTDRTAVCSRCAETDHRAHSTVPAERESRKMRAQLKQTEADVQQMIQDRLKKVDNIKHSVELSKRSIEREIEVSVQVFTALVRSIERGQAELVEEMEEKQRAAKRQADRLIQELEQEITELVRRNTELEQLSHTEDHLHLLQSFPSLCSPPHTKDWSEVSVQTDQCVGTVRRAVSKLENMLYNHEKTLCLDELRRVQQYAVDVTLDPVTAASWLILSADGKQVSLGYQPGRPLLDDPRRFDSSACVLGRQGLASGRHYWAVQVGEKPEWDLGVARESVNRKGSITVRPDQGFWAVCRRKGAHLIACAGPSVPLSRQEKPRKVGVFVDYEEGRVSFYDVEVRSHIYTYSGCCFTETLYPYFNPCLHDDGKNTAPLVICPEGDEVPPTVLESPVAQSVSTRSRQSSQRSISQHRLF